MAAPRVESARVGRVGVAGGLQLALRWSGTGPLIGLVLLGLALEIASGYQFLTFDQISAASAFTSGVGLVALGVAMLMISGEFDLSVSQSFAFAPIVMGVLMTRGGMPDWLALVIGLLAALGVGLANGIITLVGNVPSFITTLGMLFVLTSAGLILASTTPPEVVGIESDVLRILGGDVGGVPFDAPFIWMVGIGVVYAVVLEFTRYGSWTRAAGFRHGQAARAMGVPVNAVKLGNFCLCALTAGFAGCLLLASFGTATIDNGTNFNLFAIVAAVIGGTSLFGARGSMIGTMIGATILGVLSSGLVLTGIEQQYYTGIVGVILLAAATINSRIELAQRGIGWRALVFRRS